MGDQCLIHDSWQVTHPSEGSELNPVKYRSLPGALQVNNRPENTFGPSRLITTQIHSSWIPVQNICGVPDLGRIVASFISYFINNIVLLATMLVGLFRLHSPGAGTCDLILLLWKQVTLTVHARLRFSPFANMIPSDRASCGSCLQPAQGSRHW
jgi:hypothetical protein